MKKISPTPIGSSPVRIDWMGDIFNAKTQRRKGAKRKNKKIFLFFAPWRLGVLALNLLLLPSLSADLLSVGVGSFDTIRPRERMMQFQAEYKWDACWHGLQPIAGAMLSQKGSLYFCFGGCYDIYVGKHVVLTPSFAPGVYIKNGGKELGLPLEFRSSLALAVEFGCCQRIGLQFYHISNGSLGFKNPGEESLVLFYSLSIF